jgi:hypothetical protein
MHQIIDKKMGRQKNCSQASRNDCLRFQFLLSKVIGDALSVLLQRFNFEIAEKTTMNVIAHLAPQRSSSFCHVAG